MTLPTTLQWATDVNFNSPGKSWDGQPTKVTPPAGKQTEGWEPEDVIPAEYLNWWQNQVARWFDWLKLSGFWNMIQSPIDFSSSADGRVYGFEQGEGISGGNARWVAAFAGASTSRVMHARNPRGQWTAVTHSDLTTGFPAETKPVAFDPDGGGAGVDRWVVPCSGQKTLYSGNGTTWTLVSASGSNAPYAIVGLFNSLFVVVGEKDPSPNAIWTSTDGTSWTGRGDPGGLGDTLYDVAIGEDGASNPRLVAVGNAGAVCYSDNGTTWTDGGRLGGGSINKFDQVLWHATSEKWFAFAEGGAVYSSSNGSSWSAATSIPFTVTSNVIATVDYAGRLVVHGENDSMPEAFVSADDGATWDQIPANGQHTRNGGMVRWVDGHGFVMAGGSSVGAHGYIWAGWNLDESADGD